MLLAIDIGNTQTVLGCCEKGVIEPVLRIDTDLRKTEFEYASEIARILELSHVDLARIDGVILASVVPKLTEVMRQAARLMTGLEAMVVGAGIRTGLDIRLDDPGTIAADLVATAVAAKEDYPLPCVIVDFGTATAVTMVGEKGRYLGGAIYPGAEIALNALVESTSLLPQIELNPPKKVVGTNTVDAMRAGVFYSTVGAVDGILDRFETEAGKPATIVATGGLAEKIAPYCRHEIRIDKNLLLRGLELLYERNVKLKRHHR